MYACLRFHQANIKDTVGNALEALLVMTVLKNDRGWQQAEKKHLTEEANDDIEADQPRELENLHNEAFNHTLGVKQLPAWQLNTWLGNRLKEYFKHNHYILQCETVQ